MNTYASLHNHTDYSNLKLIDAINKVEDLIDYGYKIGLKAIAITDHDCLTSHIRALNYFKSKYNEQDNFKLILGNEIYITREGLVEANIEKGEKFYHCILLAKDNEGHHQLRELSSRAWKRGFFRGIMRTPTYLSDIDDIVGSNPGHLVCTTACLGGMTGSFFQAGMFEKIGPTLSAFHKLFGNDFYIELQPSFNEDQIAYNKYMIDNYWDEYNFTIATDSHYLTKDERNIHKVFLNSKDSKGNREVDAFYSSTYVMTANEIRDYVKDYIDDSKLMTLFNNTINIANECQPINLDYQQVIPKIRYEWENRDDECYSTFRINIPDSCPTVRYYFSDKALEPDKYLAHLLAEGFYEKISVDDYNEYCQRLEEELIEIKIISDNMGQSLSDYFNTMAKIIDIVWTTGDSLVGPGRGSGAGSLINYLLGITQIDPLRQQLEMPFWRFINRSRPELPDIDFDTESNKRLKIFSALKSYFNSINSDVINVCTLGTIKTKSAIRTAGKALGIDSAEVNYICSMVPNERGNDWTLEQCLNGDESHPRIQQFGEKINAFPHLLEVSRRITGLISNLSVHASGILILNGNIEDHNSIMKTNQEVMVTAWDLHDSEQMGALKYDALTVQAIDKIRTCMNLLLEDGKMEWQGSLRKTYDKYLLPANLDYTTKEMWDMVGEGRIIELFQYDTNQGSKAARLIKPHSLLDLANGNSVLRLMSEEGEQPLDIFARYKDDIVLWYQEMIKYGLSPEEQELMKHYLNGAYGVMSSQEDMMRIVMDENVSGFSIKEANKLRKAVAKKKKALITECHELFYKKGQERGTSRTLLDYVWNIQISRELGYSFSQLHTTAYSTIALQEMNLNYYYPQLYWGCACLNVNADAVDEEDYENLLDEDILSVDDSEDLKKGGKISYDKVAEAISKFSKYYDIIAPDINQARMGFIPDVANNRIIYGMKGITRIGDDLVSEIINHRPYTSIKDFISKMISDEGKKLITKDKIVNLIKAGCFDNIENKPRPQIMNDFISSLVIKKTNLNLNNFLALIRADLVPDELKYEKGVYLFTKEARKNKDGLGFYNLDDIMIAWIKKWSDESLILYIDGQAKINSSKWDKIYNATMDNVRKWIKNNMLDLIEKIYKHDYDEEYNKYAVGDILKWEMDSLNFYSSGHPLKNIQLPYKTTSISNLKDNEIESYWTIKGIKIPKYKLYRVAGTVLVKNKKSNMIVLSTPDGIIKVRLFKQQFAVYDQTILNSDGETIQESMLEKGTHLLVTGIYRDEMLVPKVYKDSGTEPLMRIILNEDNSFNRLEVKCE